MNAQARHALAAIRTCVASGRYSVLMHFTRRMDERGLFWPDIQCVLAAPSDVRDGGKDDLGRPKWIIAGKATDGLKLEIVCVLDVDDEGNLAVFVTAYWNEG